MTDMDRFFLQPGVHHQVTKPWNNGGQRHWFRLDSDLTVNQIRSLLNLLPPGSSVRCFNPECESPSDPGAWITFRRYSSFWTATFNNHGWSSQAIPVEFDDLALIFWEARNFDFGSFLGGRVNTELMADSGLSLEPPETLDTDPESKHLRFVLDRAALIRQQLSRPSR